MLDVIGSNKFYENLMVIVMGRYPLKVYLNLEVSSSTKMNTKIAAVMLVAVLTAVLISAAIATVDDADARKKRGGGHGHGGDDNVKVQINNCGNGPGASNVKCSNTSYQSR
jgi:hypothetical protein